MRERASLLLSHGHTDATDYPLGMLKDEAEIVSARENRMLAAQATLAQAAMTTTLPFSDKQSAGKAWKNFSKLIALFTGE